MTEMSTPKVTEIPRRSEPVVHDTFIDDLAVVSRPPGPAPRPVAARA